MDRTSDGWCGADGAFALRLCVFVGGGGVLSAVPKGTEQSQVDRFTPYWEHKGLFSPRYEFQTPLTQLEIICYDGDWLIVCKPSFSECVRTLPQAQTPEEYFGSGA